MPESQLWEAVFKSILGAGGVATLLFFGVWWLNRNNNLLLSELKIERESRIKLLEAESTICRNDRITLHKVVNELQGQIIDIYKSRDQKVIAEKMAQSQPMPKA